MQWLLEVEVGPKCAGAWDIAHRGHGMDQAKAGLGRRIPNKPTMRLSLVGETGRACV